MPQGTAVRNRSEPAIIATPRGPVEVVRQQMRGLRGGSAWTWSWVARRKGKVDWSEGPTAQEAIRRATLLPARETAGLASEGCFRRREAVGCERAGTAG